MRISGVTLIVVLGFGVSCAELAFASDPTISEFMASNANVLADEDGDFSDWLEIHNPDASSIDLAGWFITDDPSNLTKWEFPSVTIEEDDYVVVFTSDKDRSVAGSELHANFKLSADGEYLALVMPDGQTVVSEYSPSFPPQRVDISYGISGSTEGYFTVPTPGEENDATLYSGITADPAFSVDRGFYGAPFQLTITTATSGAVIRYTLDGSSPTAATGTPYSGPITIDQTSVVRAAAFYYGYLDSCVCTSTYIFVADVVTQSTDGSKPNSAWPDPYGPYCGFHDPQDIDYGMDPQVMNDARYTDLMDDALLSVPTMSLVTDLDNLFSTSTGIYVNAKQHGEEWERPTSLELLDPEGGQEFQINCGVRIRGGWSRWGSCPKHAFRFFFRSDYGADKLRYPLFGSDGVSEFDKIDLRCPQNYSWSFKGDPRNTFLRDIFCRDMQGTMGQPHTRSRYYHLYINGQYWGLYQTQERSEARYGASYFGGDSDDYDVMKVGDTLDVDGEIVCTDGNRDAWDRLIAATEAGFATDEAYYCVQGLDTDGNPDPACERLVDVDNLIDYMIVIYYSANRDSPISSFLGESCNNIYAVYNRNNPDGFKYFAHDNEHVMDIYGLTADRTADRTVRNGDWSRYFNPQTLHQELDTHPEYRMRFADRVHKYFFNDGPMTPDRLLDRFQTYVDDIYLAIIAESARWGDSKQDCNDGFFTRDDDWLPVVNSLINSYLPGRSAVVLNQFRTRGWYPNVDAPVFNQHGGEVAAGFELTMSVTSGTIYYTLDGTDPRLAGGAVNAGAVEYSGSPLVLTSSVLVKSRALDGGEWSALNEASFDVSSLPVIINEIMYNPDEDDAQEFVELYNPSATLAVDLSGWRLNGVGLTFSQDTVLAAGAYGVLVRDATVFEATYGTGITILAEYGGQLDNGGENLTLLDESGHEVDSVRYDDDAPWPVIADGDGPSLELIDPDQDNRRPANWAASSASWGTPGAANSMQGTTDPVPLLWVNEALPVNSTVNSDELGDYDSWIEIYNSSETSIDLGGMYLTNNYLVWNQWQIPAGTSLDPSDWMIVWADGETGEGTLHANFSLNSGGGSVGLYTSDGVIVDYLNYDALAADVSYGKYPDGSSVRREFATATPGTANQSDSVSLILNEYNAVGSDNYLKDDGTDVFFGWVEGNGGNWFELVVTEDHVDLRGWMLSWTEEPSDAGEIVFTSDLLWSDLRSGTIITIIESDTAAGGLDTDVSYDPAGGDWWINVNTLSGGAAQETYVTTTTNVSGDGPGNFSVGNDSWQLTIKNATDAVVFGPAGEGVEPSSGIGSDEVFKLEEDPSPYIHEHSDYNDGTSSTFGAPNVWSDGQAEQDFSELRSVLGICYNDEDCDDGQYCNGVETCDGGTCVNGVSPDCTDAFDCTTDTCNEDEDICVNDLDSGFCLIGGICYAEGDPNPANECEQCIPEESVETVKTATFSTDLDPSGTPRWLDIADQEFDADYQADYLYQSASVSIEYYTDAETLHGTLTAVGLKPNFSYQLKLLGIPGTDSNERIGFNGRWTEETWDGTDWANRHNLNSKGDGIYPNPNDLVYLSRVEVADDTGTSPTGKKYKYTGYLVFDYFTTDENGDAELSFDQDSSYHVLFKTSQRTQTTNDGPIRTATFVGGLPDPVLAYDTVFEETTVNVFAEWERLPAGEMRLPSGHYQGHWKLTEESFHGSGTGPVGSWGSALVAEAEFELVTANESQWSPAPAETSCGDANDTACDNPDTCDGAGACLDNHEPYGTGCEDGLFCTDGDFCQNGTCVGGEDPCPPLICNEDTDECDECEYDEDCSDGEFCTGVETCDNGSCVDGVDPCSGQMCRESDDTCVECLVASDCNDYEFCNGIEACDDGTCTDQIDPCVDLNHCDEINDLCLECLNDEECDIGEVCNLDSHLCETSLPKVTFQQGTDGYTGAVDSYLAEQTPDTSYGNATDVQWDTSWGSTGDEAIGLIRFNGIFGSEDGQIPVGAEITSSILTVVVFDQGDYGSIREILVDWNESVTYSNFGGDFGAQADEYGSQVGTVPGSIGTHDIDLTASLQAWSADPASNFGWIILPSGSGGTKFRAKEYVTLGERPKLTVEYQIECQIDADCEDHNPCTDDTCESTVCQNVAVVNGTPCPDDEFCNGDETCQEGVCQNGTDPCTDPDYPYCDEPNGECDECRLNEHCDDGAFCTGTEACSDGVCQTGSNPCTDPGFPYCDEANDECDECEFDEDCDDGQFCTGVETCDANGLCVAGTDPCDGASCDEENDNCMGGEWCAEDEDCDDGQFCNGEETCVDHACVNGDQACEDSCEQCNEDADTCEWCIYDLDGDGFIGPGDFSFFAGCYGNGYGCDAPSYRTGAQQCCIANFDESTDSFVGPGDFAGFAGCFGSLCAECETCWGNQPTKRRNDVQLASLVSVGLVAVDSPNDANVAAKLPRSDLSFYLGRPFYIELWASIKQPDKGLAAVYLDVQVDSQQLEITDLYPAALFSAFPKGRWNAESGLAESVGGCARLGQNSLGADSTWVKVATLEVRGSSPGRTTVTTAATGGGYGISVINRLGTLNTRDIGFGNVTVTIRGWQDDVSTISDLQVVEHETVRGREQ